MALPSIAMISPSLRSLATSASTLLKAASSAFGSMIRKTSEKVSCDGMACLSFRKFLKKLSFARPNAAISAQEVDPHKTDTKAITRNSPRSWRTLLARGSGTSSKADRKNMHGDEHPMRTTTHPESIPPSPARAILYALSSILMSQSPSCPLIK
jgi:hypothetical protein